MSKAYQAKLKSAKIQTKNIKSLADIETSKINLSSAYDQSDIRRADRNRMVGFISEALDTAGHIGRKIGRKRERDTAIEALGAVEQDRSLWDKIIGTEKKYKVGEGIIGQSDILNLYRLEQQELAGFPTTVNQAKKSTDLSTSSNEKNIPEIPSKLKSPTLAEESKLDVTAEELEDWKLNSGFFDKTSNKKALTQWANWQKAGKPKRDIATIGPSKTNDGLPIMNW